MKKSILILIGIVIMSCNENSETIEPNVIEVTTFKYKASVNAKDFWKEDAKIQEIYTSKQPGYITRESGYSIESNEVVIVVRWETMGDAEASMKKFMGDTSVAKFVEMIDGPTMKMNRYDIK
ncbi:hypothetical protein [Winogradskyella flava]|uniref:ABM domain-containing protein n=1 Tax=Winogradskyella flava TaxID=1884876 RepID=A0A842IKH1_9FLAO|nr:hypothetical protein [Winogradskyella flava]MBC2843782.1 hypothetical protein [Winogradskyella flava]